MSKNREWNREWKRCTNCGRQYRLIDGHVCSTAEAATTVEAEAKTKAKAKKHEKVYSSVRVETTKLYTVTMTGSEASAVTEALDYWLRRHTEETETTARIFRRLREALYYA